jgi:hypothetical protein
MSSWTDKISNEVVCGYFYAFFLVFSVLGGLSILGGILLVVSSKLNSGQLAFSLFHTFLSAGLSITSALFLYLICERALKPVRDPFQAGEDPMM